MKIKPLKILGTILQVAAPVVTGIVAGPAAGALVASAMGAAGATKIAGKKLEEKTGIRAHKVVSPAVAVATPAILAPIISPDLLETACDYLMRVCENPRLVATLPGLIALLAHMLGGNIKKVVPEK